MRGSLILSAKHREQALKPEDVNASQWHLASPLLSPSSKHEDIRTHSQIAGGEEQKAKLKKLEEKPLFCLYHIVDFQT